MSVGLSTLPEDITISLGLETELLSGLSAAAAGCLRLVTGYDHGQVVLALTAMTACTTAAGPGIRRVHNDLVHRCGRLVDEELCQECVHLRGHVGGVHGGECLGAGVFYQCGVTAIGGAQQSSALQPVDVAK